MILQVVDLSGLVLDLLLELDNLLFEHSFFLSSLFDRRLEI